MVAGAEAGAESPRRKGVEVFSGRGRLGRDRGHPERLGGSAHPARAPLGRRASATRWRAPVASASATGSSSPVDLIDIGLLEADEVALHALESTNGRG